MIDRFQKLDLQVTPIVAYGLVFLLFLFSWLGVERLNVVKQTLGEDNESLRTRLAVVENIKSQDQWSSRLDYSIAYKNQINASLWRANTSGVIAAELQQFLQKVTDDNGLNNVTIRVDSDPSKIGDLNAMSFDLTGVVDAAYGSTNLLGQLSESGRQVIINEVNITTDPQGVRSTRVILAGVIPIELTPADANQ